MKSGMVNEVAVDLLSAILCVWRIGIEALRCIVMHVHTTYALYKGVLSHLQHYLKYSVAP